MWQDKIIFLVVLVAICHNLVMIPAWYISMEKHYHVYYAAPYRLFYAPLLFFYYRAYTARKFSSRDLLLHGLPILLAWIAYAVFIFNAHAREQAGKLYYTVLYFSTGVSLLAYPIYIIKQRTVSGDIVYFSVYCMLFGLFMLYTAWQVMTHPFLDTLSIFKEDSIMGSLFMFLGVTMLFTKSFQRFNGDFVVEYSTAKSKMLSHGKRSRSHEKLTRRSLQIQHVAGWEKLENYFSSDAILNPELTLKSAASQLNVTQKKLSDQVLILYDTTFVKLLSIKRVEYAQRLLLSPEFNDLYEELPYACGFKSKATFYRHFHAIQHCSPREYRNRYWQTVDLEYPVMFKKESLGL